MLARGRRRSSGRRRRSGRPQVPLGSAFETSRLSRRRALRGWRGRASRAPPRWRRRSTSAPAPRARPGSGRGLTARPPGSPPRARRSDTRASVSSPARGRASPRGTRARTRASEAGPSGRASPPARGRRGGTRRRRGVLRERRLGVRRGGIIRGRALILVGCGRLRLFGGEGIGRDRVRGLARELRRERAHRVAPSVVERAAGKGTRGRGRGVGVGVGVRMDARGRGRRGSDVEGANDDARVGRRRRGGRERGGRTHLGNRRAPSARARRVRAPGGDEKRGVGRRARGRAATRGGTYACDILASSRAFRARSAPPPGVAPGARGVVWPTPRMRAGAAGKSRFGSSGTAADSSSTLALGLLGRHTNRRESSQHARRLARAPGEPGARGRNPGRVRARAPSGSASSSLGSRARRSARGVVARGRPEATRRSSPAAHFSETPDRATTSEDRRPRPSTRAMRASPRAPTDTRASRQRSSRAPEDEDEDEDDDEPDVGRRGPPRTTPARAFPRRGGTRSSVGAPSRATAIGAGDHRRAPAIFVSFPFAPAATPPRSLAPSPLPGAFTHAPSPPPNAPPLILPLLQRFPPTWCGDPRGVRAQPRRRAPAPPGPGGEAAAEPRGAAAPFQPFRSNARHGAIIVTDRSAPSRDPRTRPRRRNAFERAPRPAAGPSSGASVCFRFPSLGKSAAASERLFAQLRRSPQPPRPRRYRSPLPTLRSSTRATTPVVPRRSLPLRAVSSRAFADSHVGDAVVNALARKKLEEARRTHSQRVEARLKDRVALRHHKESLEADEDEEEEETYGAEDNTRGGEDARRTLGGRGTSRVRNRKGAHRRGPAFSGGV